MVTARVVCALLALGSTSALDNGLGRTPPLGWSSWNYFANDINETVIMEMADAMVSTGLSKVGYEYINIDAGYLTHQRHPGTKKLVVNKEKFPSGIRKIADHVHSLGLKLGVYTDLTTSSCGAGPGSGGHYEIDAATFAHDWQADYLKVDYCGRSVNRDPAPQYAGFAALRDALNATGRAIYYAICPHARAPTWGTARPYNGGSMYAPPESWTAAERHALANSLLVEFTNTFDLWYADPTPAGDGGAMRIPGGMLTNLDSLVQMTEFAYSAPGSFNDADMLQMCTYGEGATRHWNSTGHPGGHGLGMTLREYAAFYSLWAVTGSPLIHSADLRSLQRGKHAECLALMLNPEIIAVNQDPAQRPARLLYATTNASNHANYTQVNSTQIVSQAFVRPLSGGRVAAVLFNRGEAATSMTLDLAQLGLCEKAKPCSVSVRDVVLRKNLGEAPRSGTYSAEVESHEALFLLLEPKA